MGKYFYQGKDFIKIVSNTTNFSHRKVYRIESKPNKEEKLKLEILNEDGSEIGKVTIIHYTKRPSLFSKTQSLFTSQYNLDQKILNRKIVLDMIMVKLYEKKERTHVTIPIYMKIKPAAMTYSIILKENSHHIKNQKGKIFLYHWDLQKQDFTIVDELVLRR